MTWTTGSGGQRGGFADGQEGGPSWGKGYSDGHKIRQYGAVPGDAGWGPEEPVPVAAALNVSRSERGLLAAGAVLAVVAAIVLRTASGGQGAAGGDDVAAMAVSWGHLGFGVLCLVTLAGLVLVATRR
jgi:hypothetical protein